MISAVVLTKNEEKNIGKCLKSLHWCDEIIVIDDYSRDKTVSLAKKLGARVYQHNLKADYSDQRNFGLKKTRGDWVLFVDADEFISSQLQDEIKEKILKSKEVAGFYLKRKDKFLGKWLQFGETSRIKLLRLARKGAGGWQRPVHDVWQIKGRIGELKNPLMHQRQLTISDFLKKINQYSSLRARQLYEQKVKTNAFFIMLYPMAKFGQNYILRLGFLDGKAGFVMAAMMSIHSFLVRAKLYLLWQNRGVEEPAIPPLGKLYKKYG